MEGSDASSITHTPSDPAVILTWEEINARLARGDLSALRRATQAQYEIWLEEIINQYGSALNYLLKCRLEWGNFDEFDLVPSIVDRQVGRPNGVSSTTGTLPSMPPDTLPYFTADIPLSLVSLLRNDWPYSVPHDVEHIIIWTVPPILHPSVHSPALLAVFRERGLSKFASGATRMGITVTDEAHLARARDAVTEFVARKWREEEWDTVWWVTALKRQSVTELTHIHLLVRRKANLRESNKVRD